MQGNKVVEINKPFSVGARFVRWLRSASYVQTAAVIDPTYTCSDRSLTGNVLK